MGNALAYIAGGALQGFGAGLKEDIQETRRRVHAELEHARGLERDEVRDTRGHQNRLAEMGESDKLAGAREEKRDTRQNTFQAGRDATQQGYQTERDKAQYGFQRQRDADQDRMAAAREEKRAARSDQSDQDKEARQSATRIGEARIKGEMEDERGRATATQQDKIDARADDAIKTWSTAKKRDLEGNELPMFSPDELDDRVLRYHPRSNAAISIRAARAAAPAEKPPVTEPAAPPDPRSTYEKYAPGFMGGKDAPAADAPAGKGSGFKPYATPGGVLGAGPAPAAVPAPRPALAITPYPDDDAPRSPGLPARRRAPDNSADDRSPPAAPVVDNALTRQRALQLEANKEKAAARAAEKAALTKPATEKIPTSAIEYLRANPQYKEQFDQKFGRGAAARVLGE